MPPLRGLGGASGAQFEIARVEQRAGGAFHKRLCRAEDVPRRQERDRAVAKGPRFPELQQVLAPGAAESLAHEARGAGVGDDLGVRSEVIAVRVRHESAGLARVRIEPERVLGQVQAAVVAEGNHGSNKVTAESV